MGKQLGSAESTKGEQMNKRLRPILVLGVAALVLAACGSSGGSKSSGTTTTTKAKSTSTTTKAPAQTVTITPAPTNAATASRRVGIASRRAVSGRTSVRL